MNKLNNILKICFHLINLLLILFYIYPGNILGWLLYGDFVKEPHLTRDFIISSNHFYVFILFSALGILSYYNDKNLNLIIKYLFTLSIILELLHLAIPERSFQFSDLFANILGVMLTITMYKIWRKM